MAKLTRPEWKVGSNATIYGRRCSIRRITSTLIEWFDRDDKSTFTTPRDVKPDRKTPARRNHETLQWVATVTSAEISDDVRRHIEDLARKTGLSYGASESEYLDEQHAKALEKSA